MLMQVLRSTALFDIIMYVCSTRIGSHRGSGLYMYDVHTLGLSVSITRFISPSVLRQLYVCVRGVGSGHISSGQH